MGSQMTAIIIIIIMGLKSVSASKDVIEDLSRPGINNSLPDYYYALSKQTECVGWGPSVG